ncbi:TPA: hypothetical protein ON189_004953 [Serratia marcescens]|nr:hypothetical protein [Serratia marcescens]
MRTPGVYNTPLPGSGYWAACTDTGIRQVTGKAAVDGPWALHLTSRGGVVCRLAGEGGSLQEESAVAGMVFLSENYRF